MTCVGSSSFTEPSIFFTVAAHVPDRRNCEVLAATLRSIRCYHGGDAVTLVVDNASPSALPDMSPMRVVTVRESLSRGQLGAWAVADAVLRESRYASIQTVVLLQHSTALAAPVRLPHPCRAAALSTLVSRGSGASWMSAEDNGMRWAAAVAASLRFACDAPCTSSSSASHPFGWAAAAHGVLALSWPAWRELGALRLWPRNTQPATKALTPLWRSEPCAHGGIKDKLPCLGNESLRLHIINGGLEKLAGILLAHLNGHVPFADCYIEGGVSKVHGGTFRAAAWHESVSKQQQGESERSDPACSTK